MKHEALQSLWTFAEGLEQEGLEQTAQQLKPLLTGLEECWADLQHKSQESFNPLVHMAQMAEVGAQSAKLLNSFSQVMAEMQDFLTRARGIFDDQENADLVAQSTRLAKQLEEIRQANFLVERLLGEGLNREMEASLEVVALDMFSVFQVQLDRGQIQIEVDLPRELPKLRLERHQLFQILAHLVANAIDAVSTTTTRLIRIEAFDTGDQSVRILVSDTGGGIPISFRNRIFEPNFSTKGKNGTGLGLHIASLLADGAGGYLRLSDPSATAEPRDFTTLFELVLPCIDPQEQSDSRVEGEQEAEVLEPLDELEDFDDEELTYSEASALDSELQDFAEELNLGAELADKDEPLEMVGSDKIIALAPDLGLPNIIKRHLTRRNPNLREVQQPAELSAQLSGNDVDLVILDTQRAGSHSLEVARFLQAEHPAVELLLAVTSEQIRTAMDAFELGGYDHILMPPHSGAFVAQKIRACLNHRASRLRGQQERRRLFEACRQASQILPESERAEAEQTLQKAMSDFALLGQNRQGSQILLLAPPAMTRMTDRLRDVTCHTAGTLDEAMGMLMKTPELGVAVVVDGTAGTSGTELLASLYGSREDLAVLLFTRERDIDPLYETMGDRIGDIVLRPGEGREFFAPRIYRLLARQAVAAGHLKLVAQLHDLKVLWESWM